MWCWHKWKILAVNDEIDISLGEPGMPNCRLNKVCTKCSKYKSEYIDGHWEGIVKIDES